MNNASSESKASVLGHIVEAAPYIHIAAASTRLTLKTGAPIDFKEYEKLRNQISTVDLDNSITALDEERFRTISAQECVGLG